MWLPDVVVENRETGCTDTISSVVRIEPQLVRKVDRVRAIVRAAFDVTYYPFDKQVLQVSLGSSSMMSEQVVFRPLDGEGFMGYDAAAFDNSEFAATSFEAYVVEEVQGMLRKSRGKMDISVERWSAKLVQLYFFPELLIVVIGYSTLWYPTLIPFVMPRVATALISFLTLTTLSAKTYAIVPATKNPIWVDNFEGSCESILFFIVVSNLMITVTIHEFQHPDVGRYIELMSRLLVVVLLLLTVIFSGVESVLHDATSDYFGMVPLVIAWAASVVVVIVGLNQLKEKQKEKEGATTGP